MKPWLTLVIRKDHEAFNIIAGIQPPPQLTCSLAKESANADHQQHSRTVQESWLPCCHGFCMADNNNLEEKCK